jgi:signal transduction histidine kinase
LPKNAESVEQLIKIAISSISIDSSLKILSHAKKLASDIKYTEGEMKVLFGFGKVYYLSADYGKATFFLLEALKYIKQYKNQNVNGILAETYRMLGEVNRATKDYLKSKDYLYKAKELFLQLNDNVGLAKTYNRIASIYYETNEINKDSLVIYNIEKSNYYAREGNVGEVLGNNLNILGALYYKKNEFEKAISLYKTALLHFNDTILYTEKANVLRNISTSYIYVNIDSALYYARQSYYSAKKNKMNAFLYQSTINLHSIFKNKFNNIDSAMYYLEKAVEIQETLYNDKAYRAQLQLQYKFDEDLKDNKIKSQEQTILYQIIISIIIVTLLIFIVIILIYKSNYQKKINTTINEKNENLAKANATKDKFFSIIAHDLKNPISSFKSLIELINEDYDSFSSKEMKEFLILMKDSSQSLVNLLDNLLNWSSSQQNKIPINREHTNLSNIVKNANSLLKIQALNKNIQVEMQFEDNIYAYCDENMILTVFRNVLSNCIKYSYSGSKIVILADVVTEDEIEYKRITIIDNGVGMSQYQIDNLFSLSTNNTTTGTNGESGTGLGMILVMEFLTKNKGYLHVSSEEGKGSVFNILIPTKSSE